MLLSSPVEIIRLESRKKPGSNQGWDFTGHVTEEETPAQLKEHTEMRL